MYDLLIKLSFIRCLYLLRKIFVRQPFCGFSSYIYFTLFRYHFMYFCMHVNELELFIFDLTPHPVTYSTQLNFHILKLHCYISYINCFDFPSLQIYLHNFSSFFHLLYNILNLLNIKI